MPPLMFKENKTNPPNISSRDSNEDTHYQDDRSQGGWMCSNDRSQEHQDDNLDIEIDIEIEMKSTGKDTNVFLTDSGACNQPAWVRSDPVGKVEQQVKAINKKEKKVMEQYDAEVDVDRVESRSSRSRVIGPDIARRISLFQEEEVNNTQLEDRLPVLQNKEVLMMDVAEEKEIKKEVRTIVISRRKRKGQPRETGVAVQRIDDMFRDAGSSPMVVEDLVGNVIKRKYISNEESSMVSDRKRHKGL